MSNGTLLIPDDDISSFGGRLPTLLGCVHEGLGTAYWFRTGRDGIIRVLVRAFPATQYVVDVLDGGASLLAVAVAQPDWQPAGSVDRLTRVRVLSLLPPCCYSGVVERLSQL